MNCRACRDPYVLCHVSEPHHCPLFALLLVTDLSYCLLGATCNTKALEPSEVLQGSLPPRSCLRPWKHLPIYHSTLSAGQLCWVILASSFLPTSSEPMRMATPKIQSWWGMPVEPRALALGAPAEATAHARSLITVWCRTQRVLPSLVGSTMQANASKQTSNLVQLKTKSRKSKHVSFQARCSHTKVDQRMSEV